MKKDFDSWNKRKKQVHNATEGRFYHEREIWWCSLGVNIGSEHDGRGELFQRPVLVVRGLSRHTCVVAPLTTAMREHPMRVRLGIVGGRDASALISQMRVVDTRRFTERMDILNKDMFRGIRKAIRDMF